MKNYIWPGILFLLILIPVFGHLDDLPIRMYDESRLAGSALDMQKDGNYLVVHFDGQPELWSTKPPLMIWLQVFFLKFTGINELGIRLPSAFAGLITSFLLYFFLFKLFKSPEAGFIAVMVLITSFGYSSNHCLRTGDYDCLLCMFMFFYSISFFIFVQTNKTKYLYLTFLCLTLACLTKGIAGTLFLPALFVYSLIDKSLVRIIKNKHFYIGLAMFVFFIALYYLLREHYNHGYLQAVWNNELGGRYLVTNENHKEDFLFYYLNAIRYRFEWYYLLPCGLLVGAFAKDILIKKLNLFCFIIVLTFFLVISFSQSKLTHYDVPVYPYLAIITSIFIYTIFKILNESGIVKKYISINILPLIFLFLIFIFPYQALIGRTLKPTEDNEETENFYKLCHILKDGWQGRNNLNGYKLLCPEYSPHIMFYVRALQAKGCDIQFYDYKMINQSYKVITNSGEAENYLEKKFNYTVIYKYNYSRLYLMGSKK